MSISKTAKSEHVLSKFFIAELSDVLSAEKQLTKALPEMQNAATSPELATAFADHLLVTNDQISRLELIFKILERSPEDKKCKGMQGLIAEAQSVIKETEDGSSTRDVGLIISAQKVEHYEIAAYGSLRQLAAMMKDPEVSQLLEATLREEKETDMLLSDLAETLINEDAKKED
jgi:ferritin-like metal-binding protein YciE